jgi:hypothetical protein
MVWVVDRNTRWSVCKVLRRGSAAVLEEEPQRTGDFDAADEPCYVC